MLFIHWSISAIRQMSQPLIRNPDAEFCGHTVWPPIHQGTSLSPIFTNVNVRRAGCTEVPPRSRMLCFLQRPSSCPALCGNSQPNAQPRGEMRQAGNHPVSARRGGKDDPEPGGQGNALGCVSSEMLWKEAELGVAWQQHWLVLAASEEKRTILPTRNPRKTWPPSQRPASTFSSPTPQLPGGEQKPVQ